MLKKWWERYPGRLEYEQAELEKIGAPFKLNHEMLERGTAILTGTIKIDEKNIDLEIVFPDGYPYFRFYAYADGLQLRYHQHPFQKNLCLLGRSTEEWKKNDTVASLLLTQLPKILKANEISTKDEMLSFEKEHQGTMEVRQAEPIEMYYSYEPFWNIAVDSSWKLPESNGSLIIGFQNEETMNRYSGAVVEIQDQKGQAIHQCDPAIAELYPYRIKGRWQYVPQAIISGSAVEYLQILNEFNKGLLTPLFKKANPIFPNMGKAKAELDLIGSVCQDETGWRDKDGSLSWVFIARLAITSEQKISGRKAQKQKKNLSFFIRTERAGKLDMTVRAPELSALSGKKIAIFGLGCLGSQCAVEFAKAGVGKLTVLDADTVSPGNAARWVLGLSAVGLPKAIAVQNHISHNYPYVKVAAYNHRLGDATPPRQKAPDVKSENELLDEMLAGADLIFDATAEVGVQQFLADLAREKGIPYILISTTPGTRGGITARFRPVRTTPCWNCLQHHLTEETIVPPNMDNSDKGEVIPAGCSAPTFTGNNFDAIEISLAGVRMAVSTLMEGVTGGYPSTSYDVVVANLRDDGGNIIAPEWKTYSLTRHSACRNHDH